MLIANHQRWLVALALAFLVTGCCKKDESKKEAREAAAASAKAEAEAKQAEMIARCGEQWPAKDFRQRCQSMVKLALVDPSTATFSYVMDIIEWDNEEKCIRYYGSTVTSRDRVGSKVKHTFRCSFDAKDGQVRVDTMAPVKE